MTDYPMNGAPFTTERVIHETYRWKVYHPKAQKQLKKTGRWQKMEWHGDFFKWANCDEPEGTLVQEEPAA
ncbi:hypothetical protein [Nitratireductor sp. CH_MIT9313-5]|uniref:hypothetical protein n=1 Tax=Nitratireductor sp. CH_MIT9313-5 TaxID=3107764 RepID=UPI0030095D2A